MKMKEARITQRHRPGSLNFCGLCRTKPRLAPNSKRSAAGPCSYFHIATARDASKPAGSCAVEIYGRNPKRVPVGSHKPLQPQKNVFITPAPDDAGYGKLDVDKPGTEP